MTFLITLIQIFVLHVLMVLCFGMFMVYYGKEFYNMINETIDVEAYFDFEFDEE